MRRLSILIALGLTLGLPAAADQFELNSSDGLIILDVAPDGTVRGRYPNKQGRIEGRVDEDGAIRGVWLQPRSDHPCEEFRGGTLAWGYFRLSTPYARSVSGVWGYCSEQPRRDWEIRRD